MGLNLVILQQLIIKNSIQLKGRERCNSSFSSVLKGTVKQLVTIPFITQRANTFTNMPYICIYGLHIPATLPTSPLELC